jgi:TolB-like protein
VVARNPPSAPSSAKTVTVLYFDNSTGARDYDNLGRGMASMMITDLSDVKDIQLVEREHTQDVSKEQEAQHTKYYDQSTAVQTAEKMQPVMRDAPNSLVVQLTYNEIKRRAADKAKDKAAEKITGGVRSIFKRP